MVGGRASHSRRYQWDHNNRLKSLLINNRERFEYEHDAVGNLAAATYPDGKKDYRLPDAVGNLFRSKDGKDREYGPAGQLLRSGKVFYDYDAEGRLIRKRDLDKGGTWRYAWNEAGMLRLVLRPDGQPVSFTYDALGRRLSKRFGNRLTRWVWDGNVPMHEWVERVEPAVEPLGFVPHDKDKLTEALHRLEVVEAQSRVVGALGPGSAETTEPGGEFAAVPPALTTYVFEPGGFSPLAKVSPDRSLSIVTDHLGTPAVMYDRQGKQVWENRMDIYGRPLWTDGWAETMCFRYPGQYEDVETGLSYNRFRYYDAGEGFYINRDPIGLAGGNPTLYGYVRDVNGYVDAYGLLPWERGKFNDWFNNASPTEVLSNKNDVSDALRRPGGKHEMFPVSIAHKARSLGFTAEEIKKLTVDTKRIVFVNVRDTNTGKILPPGAHHGSKAGRHFHMQLISALNGAKSKAGALKIIQVRHQKHMKLKKICGPGK